MEIMINPVGFVETKEMTNAEILVLSDGLTRVGGLRVPIAAAYAISKTKTTISPILDDIEARRVELVKLYAGDGDSVPKDKMGEFTEDWGDVLAFKNSINLHTFSINVFDADMKIESDVLFLLSPVLTD